VFFMVVLRMDGQRIQYEVIFSDEKVNASSTKSTNPGKGTTESGKADNRIREISQQKQYKKQ